MIRLRSPPENSRAGFCCSDGKLDEELGRMSEIADSITAGCLLLCNESFASTTEREGSQTSHGLDSFARVFGQPVRTATG